MRYDGMGIVLVVLSTLFLLVRSVKGALVLLGFADTALVVVRRRMTRRASGTYSMSAIFLSLEMDHTVQAGEACASTLIAVRIEFFLR
jgi:hypothetical protein